VSAPASPAGVGRLLLPVSNGRQVRDYLRSGPAGRWRLTVATGLALIAESTINLLPPLAIGWLTQDVVEHRPGSAVITPVVLLVAAALAGAITAWASGVLLARMVLPEVARLREDVVACALAVPIERVEDGGIGDLVSRVSGDVDRVTEAAQSALGSFVGAALTIVITLIGLASLDWRLALAGLLAVPIQAHTLRWYLRRSRPLYAGGRVAEGRRTATLLDVFTALPTVRAFRLEQSQLGRVEASSEQAIEVELRATRLATRFFGRLNGAEFLGLAAILMVSYLLVRRDALSIGAATTGALFFAALFDPINTVLGVFDSIQQAGAGLGRLVGITFAATALLPDAAPAPVAALRAESVSFGYGDGPTVLSEVSVHVEPGHQLAVVGASGSGKSTLAALLAGVRRPRRGEVTLGGIPVADLGADRPGLVALVTQDTHVFLGTVADNLRLARPEADIVDVRAALSAVNAETWVDALPAGVDTEVGSGGHPLTAGQAQHLALARLLLLDPAVVILDEATAEAGSDTARLLDFASRRVIHGRTAVVIAHRLSQTGDADTVIVMRGGVIVEQGSHQELTTAGGPYAELWQAWTNPVSGGRTGG
jgi:ATP-binding cassette subfamily C protein